MRKEGWEKLLSRLQTPSHADRAMELLLADARLREQSGWDWATHGYGQTAFLLVQAAAAAGAPDLAEDILERREALHLSLNKDLVPSLMRKVYGGAVEGLEEDLEVAADVVQELYEQEAELMGGNSPEAAYELSRMLRKAEDVDAVEDLYEQIVQESLAVRERLLDDMERWLAKRGVRVGPR